MTLYVAALTALCVVGLALVVVELERIRRDLERIRLGRRE
jgi:hypothetical protein